MTLDLATSIQKYQAVSRLLRARSTTRSDSFDETLATASMLTHAGRFEDALVCLRPLVDGLADLDEKDRHTLAHIWALSLYATGRVDDLRTFATETSSLLDPETRARVLLKLAWAELKYGQKGAHLKVMETARRVCPPASSPRSLAELMYLEGYSAMSRSGGLVEAHAKLGLATSLFRLQGEQLYLAHALVAHSVVQWGLGHTGFARSLIEEALVLAAELGNYRTLAMAMRQLGIYKQQEGEFSDSDEILSQVKRLHDSHDAELSPDQFKNELARARLRSLQHRPDEVLQVLESIRSHLPDMDAVAASIWHEYEGIARFQLLDYMAALESFGRAEKELQNAGVETHELAEVHWQAAEVHLAMHNPRVALDLVEKALKVVHECKDETELGQILRVKASALAQLGQIDEAIRLFEEAIEELRRRNYQYELAVALTRLAETLDEDGQRAVEAATEAIAIFNRIGLPRLAADATHARDVARLKLQAIQRVQERNRISSQQEFIIAESTQMKNLLEDCQLIARSSATVVVSGETGVGKEVVARYIHEHSQQAEGPFVAINCAALPESLFERELFGHRKGAFTGASRDSIGLVTSATHGTLFFDEIGELPLPLQAKLLRLLQDGSYRRVGDVTEYRAEIRILAATNRNLEQLVDEGRFREDLWYRLNAFDLRIPPLRERKEDIVPLTDLFLEQESQEKGLEFWMDKAARNLFEAYPWPGNVRELESAVRAGAALAIETGCIQVEHLPRTLREWTPRKSPPVLSLEKHLEVEERRIILHALRHCNNSRSEAARFLGIGRNTLYDKMDRLGITLGKEANG